MNLPLASFRPAGRAVDAVAAPEVAGHLLFVSEGMVSVATGDTVWALWPQRALWVPADADYHLYDCGGATVFELALGPASELPMASVLVAVSPLFRELIIEGDRLASEPCDEIERACICSLIVSRLRSAAPQRNAGVQLPGDNRLRRICDAIIADPSDNRTIDDWASDVGMSRRTLTRRFRDETGLSFSIWRQRARLQEAITRLEQGQPITTIAFDIGYESPGSFSTIFRQTFGTTPSRFLSRD